MRSHNNIPALTGFRFIAAFMVFLVHFPMPGASHFLLRLNQSGYAGVTFFFVLSGFVISYNYFPDFNTLRLDKCWNFFIARIARIYPLYLFTILLVWMDVKSTNLLPYLLAVQSWSGNIGIAFGLNGPAWSVSVEFFLYAMFPLLAFLLAKAKLFASPKKMLLTFILISTILFLLPTYFYLTGKSTLDWGNPLSAHRWLYRMPLTRLLDFLLGMLAAAIYTQYGSQLSLKRGMGSGMSYLACLVIIVLMNSKHHIMSAYSFDASYALPFFFLILGLSMNTRSWISKLLASGLFILLGEISYAFYLIHVPVKILFFGGGVPDLLQKWIAYSFFLLMIICLAYGLHKIIEVPCRRYLRNLLSFNPIQSRVVIQGQVD